MDYTAARELAAQIIASWGELGPYGYASANPDIVAQFAEAVGVSAMMQYPGVFVQLVTILGG